MPMFFGIKLELPKIAGLNRIGQATLHRTECLMYDSRISTYIQCQRLSAEIAMYAPYMDSP